MARAKLDLYSLDKGILSRIKNNQTVQRQRDLVDSSGVPKNETFFVRPSFSVLAPPVSAVRVFISSFTNQLSSSLNQGLTSGFVSNFTSSLSSGATTTNAESEEGDVNDFDAYGIFRQEPNRLNTVKAKDKDEDEDGDENNEFRLVFLNDIRARTVINSQQSIIAGPWTYEYELTRTGTPETITCPPDAFNPSGYTLQNTIRERATASTRGAEDNRYNEFSTTFSPSLFFGAVGYALPSQTQLETTDGLSRWLLLIRNFINESTTVCGSPFQDITFSGMVDSVGPAFPRSHVYPRPTILLQSLTNTPRYIYVTALLRERRYPIVSGIAGSYISPGVMGFNFSNETRVARLGSTLDFYEYGYYVRFDTLLKTVESRITLLDQGLITGSQAVLTPDSPSSFVATQLRQQLVQGMYDEDPRKLLVDPVIALDADISNFGYDPSTGDVYFHGFLSGTAASLIWTGDAKTHLYSAKIGPETDYEEVFSLLKAAKNELATRLEAPEFFTAGALETTFKLEQTISVPASGQPNQPDFSPTIIGVVPRLKE